MSATYDVILIGLGAMGSAAAAQLAARGQRVLGLDRYFPPHDRGSSHGQSRVIRQAYFESPSYVPLLLRAYELWRELEDHSGSSLLVVTGGLMLGRSDSAVVAGSLRSARAHGLPHELLDAQQIRRYFPAFAPGEDIVALFEANAGFVHAELAVRAQLDRAAHLGATLLFKEEVTAWQVSASGVRINTKRGSYHAAQLVICAGAWAGRFLAPLVLPLRVERQVQFWFEPRGDAGGFAPDRFPIWIWDIGEGAYPYGLPAIDTAVKVALHGPGRECTVDTIERKVREEDVEAMRAVLRPLIPVLSGRCVDAVPCLYTSTPDGHFVLDRHPGHDAVWIVSPCSGHGFKFSPVIGEIVADLVSEGRTRHDIGLFGLSRFL
ncbi:MAG: N-methyl-L-tryptophan oxidase [Gammaproteobacteria bacterium]